MGDVCSVEPPKPAKSAENADKVSSQGCGFQHREKITSTFSRIQRKQIIHCSRLADWLRVKGWARWGFLGLTARLLVWNGCKNSVCKILISANVQ